MMLLSIFRDAETYVPRFVDQVKVLRELEPNLRVIVAEGDSHDDTYERLCSYDLFQVLKVEHGGPSFPSVDHPARWRQIACVCNVVLAAGVRDLRDEPVVYVESDLIWDAETLQRLADHTVRLPAVSPMSMAADGKRFYDIWGYRRHGERFSPHAPYHPDLGSDIIEIDSSGSCFAMSSTAANAAHFGHTDCVLGIGRSLRWAGMKLYLDPALSVRHP